jgi:antitoxin component of MazEF toxin-antitoxin module
MIECEAKLKSWGNSIGVLLPKEKLKKENLSSNSLVKLIVLPAEKITVADLFGKKKNWKTPTKKLLKEIDKEFDSKFFK